MSCEQTVFVYLHIQIYIYIYLGSVWRKLKFSYVYEMFQFAIIVSESLLVEHCMTIHCVVCIEALGLHPKHQCSFFYAHIFLVGISTYLFVICFLNFVFVMANDPLSLGLQKLLQHNIIYICRDFGG